MNSKLPLAIVLSSALMFGACFGEVDDDNNHRVGGEPPAAPDAPVADNNAPTISGSPLPTILQGQPYEFTPTASDADGDSLEFTIARKPSWATFDRSTGRLAGTPTNEDVGNFTNVGITVSDGKDSAVLPNFDITVEQIAVGSMTLSWMPPTANVDGSALTNLTGYRIYYGRSANSLDQLITLNNPGLTRYVVDNLSAATWYFAMTAVNSNGTESVRSATASKTVT